MRRQLYVMDTYVTDSERHTNHSMMLIHSYLSWAVVVPAITGEVCIWFVTMNTTIASSMFTHGMSKAPDTLP